MRYPNMSYKQNCRKIIIRSVARLALTKYPSRNSLVTMEAFGTSFTAQTAIKECASCTAKKENFFVENASTFVTLHKF